MPDDGDGTVTRIIASSGALAATIRAGGYPSAITVSRGCALGGHLEPAR